MRAALLATILSFLTACSALTTSSETAVREYWPVPATELLAEQTTLRVAVSDVDVAMPRGLDRTSLLHLQADSGLRAYAGAQWADRASTIVQNFVRTALTGVTQPEPGLGGRGAQPGAARIALDVPAFYTTGEGVDLDARLDVGIRLTCGDVVYFDTLKLREGVAERRLGPIVAAHRRNLSSLVRRLYAMLSGCQRAA